MALEVLIHGPLLRRELATRLDLSAATLSRLSAPLVETGLLVEAAETIDGAVGRPARPLDVNANSHHFAGIKLTDRTAYGVVTNLRAEPSASAERTLDAHDVGHVVDVLADLVRELGSHVNALTAVGLILGGHSPDHRVVSTAPFLGWRDVPLAQLLCDRTGVPAVLDNDLAALTSAEHWFGAGKTMERFAVLTVGIAVGYGLFCNGKVVRGPDVGIGLVGHFPLETGGPVCPKGHRGCAESLLSQASLTAQASTALRRTVTYDDVLDLARSGNPVARTIVDEAGAALGKLVAAVADLTMPEAVFLSGEGIGLADVAMDAVHAGIARHRHPNASPVTVIVQPYDVNQWARGAAAAAIQHFTLDGLTRHPGQF